MGSQGSTGFPEVLSWLLLTCPRASPHCTHTCCNSQTHVCFGFTFTFRVMAHQLNATLVLPQQNCDAVEPLFEGVCLFNCQVDLMPGQFQQYTSPFHGNSDIVTIFEACLEDLVYTSVLGVLGPTEEASFPPNLYPFLSLLKTSLDGSKISCTFLQGTDWRIFVMWLHPIPKRKTMGAGPASFEVPLEEEPDFSPLTFSDHWCCSNVMFSGWFHRAPDCLLTLRRRSHIWWKKACITFRKTDPDEAYRGSEVPDSH